MFFKKSIETKRDQLSALKIEADKNIKDIFEGIFSDEIPHNISYCIGYDYIHTLQSDLRDNIDTSVKKYTAKLFDKVINKAFCSIDERINSEDFIDQVVDKINRKQLR